MKLNIRRLLGMNFAERAAQDVDNQNGKLSRDIAARLSRGSVARQNGAVLSLDELEKRRKELTGVKVSG